MGRVNGDSTQGHQRLIRSPRAREPGIGDAAFEDAHSLARVEDEAGRRRIRAHTPWLSLCAVRCINTSGSPRDRRARVVELFSRWNGVARGVTRRRLRAARRRACCPSRRAVLLLRLVSADSTCLLAVLSPACLSSFCLDACLSFVFLPALCPLGSLRSFSDALRVVTTLSPPVFFANQCICAGALSLL